MEETINEKPKIPRKKKMITDGTSEKKPKAVKPRAKKEKVVVSKEEPVRAPDLETTAREYLQAVGRRKQAIADVRIYRRGSGAITVNQRKDTVYFPQFELIETVRAPLVSVGQADKVDVAARVEGGGLRGQAEAVRLGISRALVKINPTFRVSLKRLGYLKRDPRVKERKKYGLKKARRAPQWAKR